MTPTDVTLPPDATFSEEMLGALVVKVGELSERVNAAEYGQSELLAELQRVREATEGTCRATKSINAWIYVLVGLAALLMWASRLSS
jgi:hypothetical protein